MKRFKATSIVSKCIKKCFPHAIAPLVLMLVLDACASPAPTLPTKTNINEVTNEFDMHITNKKDLDIQVEDLKNMGINASQSSNTSDLLSAEDLSKMGGEQSRLSGISENDLETRGMDARYSKDNNYFDEFETDYTRPGATRHLKDAEEIAHATEKKLGELTKFLRDELKIDCTEVAKSPEVKDPYYIEIEKEQTKEVEYDPKFCEHPRYTYGCSDTMTMTCLQRSWSILWDNPATFQEKKMVLSLGEVQQGGWWYGHYWKKKRYGVHLRGDSGTQKAIRIFIAKKLNVKIGHIHEYIRVEGRGNGSPDHNIQDKHYAWGSYNVWYRFRGGEETCDKWSNERWDEQCNLTPK